MNDFLRLSFGKRACISNHFLPTFLPVAALGYQVGTEPPELKILWRFFFTIGRLVKMLSPDPPKAREQCRKCINRTTNFPAAGSSFLKA
jgi:hypothetical protein